MALYDIISEATDIKPVDVGGPFKKWLETSEGQRAVSRGITVEMEHTDKRSVARTITIQHLKEDRRYYEKLAKAGIKEGIYDNPKTAYRDLTDNLIDQATGDDEEPTKPGLFLALHAIENPNKAKQYAVKSKRHKQNMLLSLKELIATTVAFGKSIQGLAVIESSMGVAGPMIANPETDAGTGIPVKDPRKRTKPVPAKRMPLGAPAKGSMVGTNPMIPGRSGFAKAVE